MDLSDLRISLLSKDNVNTAGTIQAGKDGWVDADANVAADILQKHRNSTQPESKQLCLILSSVLEALKQSNIQATPTAIFASLMSTLQTKEAAGVSGPLCNALSMIMLHVPVAVMRKKCIECSKVFFDIINSNADSSQLVKPALGCLAQAVAATGPTDWTALSPSFNLLLGKLLDCHPKIRKKAQNGIVSVFTSLQDPLLSPCLAEASNNLLNFTQNVLSSPEKAAQQAAKASNKERSRAEEVIKRAVSDSLRLMGSLRQIIHLIPASHCQSICSQLLELFPLQQILLTTSATEILLSLCDSNSDHTSVASLNDILSALLSSNILWQSSDATLQMSIIKLLESLTLRIFSNPQESGKTSILPQVVNQLVPQLSSNVEGVARGSANALDSIFQKCLTEDFLSRSIDDSNKRRPSELKKIVVAVESSFGAQYYQSWELSLAIATTLVQKIGRPGAYFVEGIVQKIGELCAGADDIAAEESGERAHIAHAAQESLGVCLRSLGPEIVLQILPLELEEALDGQCEGRTWLIPLLKMHIRSCRLSFWITDLYPTACALEHRRNKVKEEASQSREHNTLYALELQLWSTLPSFCSWAEDISDVFSEWTGIVGPLFEKRSDLRLYISQGLQVICSQLRLILKHYGISQGFQDPCLKNGLETSDNPFGMEDVDIELLEHASKEAALIEQKKVQSLAKVWLPLLLNAFVNTQASRRNQLQAAISSYACICGKDVVKAVFKSAISRLMKIANQIKTGELGRDAVLDGGDTDTERYCTYLEAIYCLLGGIDEDGIKLVYKAIHNGLQEKEPSVQKKSYKILNYIIDDRPDVLSESKYFEEILDNLLEGSKTAISASRGFRIKCLKSTIILLIHGSGEDINLSNIRGISVSQSNNTLGSEPAVLVMMPMVSEIILSIKESNKKTRAAAFDLLVEVGKELEQKDPEGGLVWLVNMVLGGLAGSTSQMISASVMALARLLFEFTPSIMPMIHDLIPAIVMLLRSKAREVIKSVLGFLKVVVIRLDSTTLTSYTPMIVEGILVWAGDSKNKFRLKVRVILEKLARKVGFDVLQKSIPESHKSLLSHIRKQMNRKDRFRDSQSEVEWDEMSLARTMDSKAKSGRGSAWQTDIFSEDLGAKSTRKSIASMGKALSNGERARTSKFSSKSVPSKASKQTLTELGEPLNLLEPSASRRMVRMNVRRSALQQQRRKEEDEIEFEQGEDGRLIVKEERKSSKRARDDFLDGFESDDSDIEDIKGIQGASLALRGAQSIAKASSYAATAKSGALSTRSLDKKRQKGSQHSGKRFKAKGTGGDVKGKSSLEPYAYWPLDRKLLNRRTQKSKSAREDLRQIVGASKDRRSKKQRR